FFIIFHKIFLCVKLTVIHTSIKRWYIKQMDIIDWTVLSVLFENKNITETGKYLRISQPAITYRINKLEEEFEVKLVYRGRKGVVFTPQGEFLVNYASRMLNELQTTKDHILHFENKVQGVLRLSASSIFSRYKLPEI